ncbi:universal stress protein [Streptomyces sp. VRA16 Mangrove soil]|uniref:universal stress protein n=1 Tax=Streptomyces sp. VRA16 Mangrove soil TaxID=2817434 RepID=UPI001A9D1F51|nr:universal stress protein [Streptomyces sp. VRA16 Mangrove soil]MBO1331227.1 universal stress protein [Streptomyces sp. VRA16 Mangrove soil]
MFQRILVAVEPGKAHDPAVRLTGELARMTGAHVRVLHVATTMIAADTAVRLEDDDTAQNVVDDAIAVLLGMGVDAQGELRRGLSQQVAQEISAATEDFGADLLVVSPHHRGSLAALLNPRVSDAVAHNSRIAVLLAPTDGMQSQD